MESRGREGGFETPLPTSGPRGAQSHLTERENIPRATGARTSSKKKPAPPLARAERKPLDQKKKPAPRHQRESLLKEKTSPALWPARSASYLTERKTSPAPPAREPAQRKKQLCLWPARSAKPFDRKRNPNPRHRRVILLKRNLDPMEEASSLYQRRTKNESL